MTRSMFHCPSNLLALQGMDVQQHNTLIVDDAIIGLARLLADGVSSKEAKQQWLANTEKLVDWIQSYRSETTIYLSVEHEPDAIALPKLTLYQAEKLAVNDKEIVRFDRWVKALSTPLGKRATNFGNPLLEKRLETQSETTEATAVVKEENDLLLLQLQQVQEELESTHSQLQQLKDQTEKNKAVEDNSAHKELEEENELLLLQLQQVQEELEHYFVKCQRLEQTEAELETQKLEVARLQELLKPEGLEPQLQRQKENYSNVGPFSLKGLLKINKERKVVQRSSLFDADWYITQYQDVADYKKGAADHYIRYGAAQGRNPGPNFNTLAYLMNNEDVSQAGLNPLVHYELYGKREQREW